MESKPLRLTMARLWARKAGREALQRFGDTSPRRKEDRSLVTEADRAVERMLVDGIEGHFPEDRILGEEFGRQGGEGSWEWFIDPIDGTAAYATQLHVWCVSLAAYRDRSPRVGVVWVPFTREEYHLGGDGEVRKNGEVLPRPRPGEWDAETLLCVPSRAHRDYRIDFPGKCRSLGSTAYHMAMVLEGRAVAALIGRPNIWDLGSVWGMGQSLGVQLRNLRGEKAEAKTLLAGQRPDRPLLFGPTGAQDRLADRIERVE